MSKELKTWENLLEGYDKNEDVIYFADKDKLDTIEVALKEHEQYKAFEEEAGISVLLLIRLIKYLDKVYRYDLDEPFYVKDMLSGEVNPITPVYLGLDLENKRLVESYNADEPWETEYSFSEYGKTWALAKEEL